MVAYLRWNKESGKIDSFFLDSKNKDELINDEIKLFNDFCSDKEGSLLLQAGQQAAWNNRKKFLPHLKDVNPHLILLAEILKDFKKAISPLTTSVDDQNQVLFDVTNFIYSTEMNKKRKRIEKRQETFAQKKSKLDKMIHSKFFSQQ
jgi:hypothetical protein